MAHCWFADLQLHFTSGSAEGSSFQPQGLNVSEAEGPAGCPKEQPLSKELCSLPQPENNCRAAQLHLPGEGKLN